jgi:hypothetical protein
VLEQPGRLDGVGQRQAVTVDAVPGVHHQAERSVGGDRVGEVTTGGGVLVQTTQRKEEPAAAHRRLVGARVLGLQQRGQERLVRRVERRPGGLRAPAGRPCAPAALCRLRAPQRKRVHPLQISGRLPHFPLPAVDAQRHDLPPALRHAADELVAPDTHPARRVRVGALGDQEDLHGSRLGVKTTGVPPASGNVAVDSLPYVV